MSSDNAGLIEVLLVFGAVIALALYDVVRLRRSMRVDGDRAAQVAEAVREPSKPQ